MNTNDINTNTGCSSDIDQNNGFKEEKYSMNSSIIHILCVPELLEASIIDDAKYHSVQYLKNQDIFSSNHNMKATKKKLFMSRWITKVQYNPFKSLNQRNNKKINPNPMKLQQPLSADELYKEIYPKNIKLHKIKILCFLDPNTYNKNSNHHIKLPAVYYQYKNIDNKFGDVHITYLPAAKLSKDSYHTSCDYNGYHFTYKLYDYCNLKKHNGVQYVAETYFYKQQIGNNKKQYLKKEILDLKTNPDDKYIAFLLSFVWNLFFIFDQCCNSDGQSRKSIKFKICKKMAIILNQQHFNGKIKGKNNQNNWNKNNIPRTNFKIKKKRFQKNKNQINDNNHSSYSPSARPNDYNHHCYNDGPLKMEMW